MYEYPWFVSLFVSSVIGVLDVRRREKNILKLSFKIICYLSFFWGGSLLSLQGAIKAKKEKGEKRRTNKNKNNSNGTKNAGMWKVIVWAFCFFNVFLLTLWFVCLFFCSFLFIIFRFHLDRRQPKSIILLNHVIEWIQGHVIHGTIVVGKWYSDLLTRMLQLRRI